MVNKDKKTERPNIENLTIQYLEVQGRWEHDRWHHKQSVVFHSQSPCLLNRE